MEQRIIHSKNSGYHQLLLYIVRVELHLFRKIGAANHPDLKNIRIIEFFFENRLHWEDLSIERFPQMAALGYIFIYVQIKHYYIIPYMYITNGRNI